MNKIWNDLYQAAKAVQNDRDISAHVSAGCVAAAIESASGKIYTGVCIDTASTLGICAERNALFHMITCGENAERALCDAGRKNGQPCGACREFMAQLMETDGAYKAVQILLDYDKNRVVTLGELTPEWWI